MSRKHPRKIQMHTCIFHSCPGRSITGISFILITIMITATQHEMLHPCIFRPGTYI